MSCWVTNIIPLSFSVYYDFFYDNVRLKAIIKTTLNYTIIAKRTPRKKQIKMA